MGKKYVIVRTCSAGVFAGNLESREGKEAIEAHDNFAVVKLRGLKNDFAVPWSTIYRFAQAQIAERALKAQKAQLGLE